MISIYCTGVVHKGVDASYENVVVELLDDSPCSSEFAEAKYVDGKKVFIRKSSITAVCEE